LPLELRALQYTGLRYACNKRIRVNVECDRNPQTVIDIVKTCSLYMYERIYSVI